MSAPRTALPTRREAVTETVTTAAGASIIATVGFAPDTGLPLEVFLSGAKDGSMMAAILDDTSVVISLALQHGIPAQALLHSVSPGKASLVGAALELVASYEAPAASLGLPPRRRPPPLPAPG